MWLRVNKQQCFNMDHAVWMYWEELKEDRERCKLYIHFDVRAHLETHAQPVLAVIDDISIKEASSFYDALLAGNVSSYEINEEGVIVFDRRC